MKWVDLELLFLDEEVEWVDLETHGGAAKGRAKGHGRGMAKEGQSVRVPTPVSTSISRGTAA